MNTQPVDASLEATASTQDTAIYEAPAIESVLTPESLEREVLYAGNPPGSQIPN